MSSFSDVGEGAWLSVMLTDPKGDFGMTSALPVLLVETQDVCSSAEGGQGSKEH